ncbi:MAG TPA: long-chain fatty acid--CoA ligase [Thermoanaerobaculia bacterium]|nr:long-chain fatty acid--CoA ligase [Thermoanaerobaculia bacterium]
MVHGDLLGERARLTPDKTALVYVPTGERFTYRELDDRAVRLARVWREGLGLAKGDRFAVLADNRVEYLDAFFAAPKAGVILVPLGTRLTPRELAGILEDAQPAGLLYGAEHAETVRVLQDLVSLDHWVAFDEPIASSHFALRDLAVPDGPWTRERCDPEDLWCLLYTSGTTGKPKGVMLPHRMVVWNGYNTVIGWQLRADDVSPIFTPLYHAGGLGAFLAPIFTIGGTVVLHRGFEAAEVWRTIERERCTVVLGVPTIYKLLMEDPGFETVDLSSVRWLISGGAPLPTWIIEAYQRRGVVFKQGYGLTEVGVNCFAMTVEESVAKPGSIGKPLMFTETLLIGEDGTEVPVGEVGELLLRGPHVSRGYWNNPDATAAALDEDGWFHTGDLARRDAEGFHFIAGRKKDMIISGGVNVYPAEIEGELLLHPQVRDAAVVGIPHPTWGEAGVAFLVAGGEPPAPEDLAAFLGEKLAKYKIPREFVFVEALPRTPYGKVVKGELRDGYLKERS